MGLCFLVSSVHHVCKYILLFKTYVPIGVLYFHEFAKFGGFAHPLCGLLGVCGGLPGKPVFPGASPGVPPPHTVTSIFFLQGPTPTWVLNSRSHFYSLPLAQEECVCAYMYVHVCAWV